MSELTWINKCWNILEISHAHIYLKRMTIGIYSTRVNTGKIVTKTTGSIFTEALIFTNILDNYVSVNDFDKCILCDNYYLSNYLFHNISTIIFCEQNKFEIHLKWLFNCTYELIMYTIYTKKSPSWWWWIINSWLLWWWFTPIIILFE